MAPKSCSDEEFVRLFTSLGARETAKVLKIQERDVYKRRRRLEERLGNIAAPTTVSVVHPGRIPDRKSVV